MPAQEWKEQKMQGSGANIYTDESKQYTNNLRGRSIAVEEVAAAT